jgi:hypothetical protein
VKRRCDGVAGLLVALVLPVGPCALDAVTHLPLDRPQPVATLARLLDVGLVPRAQEPVDHPHDGNRRQDEDEQARGEREVRIPVPDALDGICENAQFFPLFL